MSMLKHLWESDEFFYGMSLYTVLLNAPVLVERPFTVEQSYSMFFIGLFCCIVWTFKIKAKLKANSAPHKK